MEDGKLGDDVLGGGFQAALFDQRLGGSLHMARVHEVVGPADCCVTFVEGTGRSSENSVGRTSMIPLADLGEDGVDLPVNLSCLAFSAATESLEGRTGDKENLHEGGGSGFGVVGGVGGEVGVEERAKKFDPTFTTISWKGPVKWGTFCEQI